MLFHTLAGAMILDLARQELIEVEDRPHGARGTVRTVFGARPSDQLLAQSWDRIDQKPSKVGALVWLLGPTLRSPVLDRLVERGHLGREKYRALGLFNTTKLIVSSTRRQELVEAVRAVLVDGAIPDDRIASITAMLSASGNLAAMHADIPWSGEVYTRGQHAERLAWSASATSDAVRSTMAAVIASNALVSVVIADR